MLPFCSSTVKSFAVGYQFFNDFPGLCRRFPWSRCWAAPATSPLPPPACQPPAQRRRWRPADPERPEREAAAVPLGGQGQKSPRRDGTGRGGEYQLWRPGVTVRGGGGMSCGVCPTELGLLGGGGGLRIRPQPTRALPPFLFEQYYFTHSSPV